MKSDIFLYYHVRKKGDNKMRKTNYEEILLEIMRSSLEREKTTALILQEARKILQSHLQQKEEAPLIDPEAAEKSE